ncbi:MAG: glycosyltransferase 87 family protein [Acidilobaceae archaeon]
MFLAFPHSFSPAEYGQFMQKVLQLHYYITASYLLLSYLSIVFVLPSLAAERWRPYLLLLVPSMYMFSVYNWDVLAAALFVLSLYAFERGRHELSGTLAGLSVSTKLLTLFGGTLLALALLREGRRADFWRYSLAFVAAAALPYLAVLLLSPHGFSRMISHHATWYCENCLYMLLSSDIWSSTHRVLAALSIGFLAGSLLTLALLRRVDIRRAAFVSVSVPITFNYVFTPQMMAMLAPLALLTLPLPLFLIYALADALNAAALIVFFNEANPWTLPSTTQKVFMGRNVIMAVLTLIVLASLFRRRG